MNMKKARVKGDLNRIPSILVALVALTVLSGCASTDPAGSSAGANRTDSSAYPEIERLFNEGNYRDALRLCMHEAETDPYDPELIKWRNRAMSAILDERAMGVLEREEQTEKAMALDSRESGFIPYTYGLERYIEGREEPFASQDSDLQRLLGERVSIFLKEADVSKFIETISASEGINMIADSGLASDRRINIEVEDVPLREVLDFMSRNYDIEFYLGETVIWVTDKGRETGGPLQTRVYELKRGLQLYGSDWEEGERPAGSDLGLLSEKATILPEKNSYIADILEKFVPEVEGSRLHVMMGSNTVIAKNTSDNLRLIGDILEIIDRSPPQVLIEARFIEVSQSNLRELGLEWTLDSPLTLSRQGIFRDGQWVREPRTQIDAGDIVRFDPNILSETEDRSAQGLNLTYQGVLTEPMFQAVLHAIEVAGDGKTLSVPRVTTVNNSPAKLRDGDDLLYYRQFEAQGFNLLDREGRRYTVTALIPKGDPALAELGITLVAVPSVGADNRTISLLLTPAISSLERFVSYQDGDEETLDPTDARIRQVVVKLPVIKRREIQTKVIVESGETVVLGGLIRNVRQESEQRVPLLGALPIVGHLFRRTDVSEENRNLLIFVTATVINERGESVLPLRAERRSGGVER